MGGITPDWLAQLSPPHAPPPAGWWPLAPGWWILLVIFIAVAAGIFYWLRRPDIRLRRLALRELKNIQKKIADDKRLARELEHLMRRYAVARYGRDTVANLSGKRWLDFVVGHGGESWSGDCGTNLLRIAYGGEATPYRTAWLAGAQAFIRRRN